MTIQDMLDQGIEIQGKYKVTKFDYGKECDEILAEGNYFRHYEISDKVLDMEIKYVYVPQNESHIVFEVEDKL